ncbi:hypothetical protein, partial [Streptomyces fuscigenes]|uniref:hypothetical protein n=1 Tax=Streptomyces fuscigenes TaxID=1528880 RepID=UPI001F181CC8
LRGLLLVPALLAAAAGCGVRPSDVVQAGEPATGLRPSLTVYFYARAPDGAGGSGEATETAGGTTGAPGGTGGSPAASPPQGAGEPSGGDGADGGASARRRYGTLRQVPRPGAPSVVAAVRALFAGPTSAEADVLTTELPATAGPPTVLADGSSVVVRLPAGTGHLSVPGLRQLLCTAADALHAQEQARFADGGAHPVAGGAIGPDAAATSAPSAGSEPVRVTVEAGGRRLTVKGGACPTG